MFKKKGLLYALATPRFFAEGPCGRVSHAQGFVSGVTHNGGRVSILSGAGARDYIMEAEGVAFFDYSSRVSLVSYIKFVFLFISLVGRHSVVVVRWRPFLPFVLFPALFLNRNLWFEVNGLTGINSNVFFVRFIVKSALFLTTNLFNVITVSEVALEQISSISSFRRKKMVVKNGFNESGFSEYVPIHSKDSLPNLVYFGRKQSYYDWHMVYQTAEDLQFRGVIGGLCIFGFEEPGGDSVARFFGEFSAVSLVDSLAKIENPILLLPVQDSGVARAGSPMKMYEYAALALPVVVGSSLSSQCSDFESFYIYRSGSSTSLTEKILEVTEDYEQALLRSQKNRIIARECYTWRSVTKKWVDESFQ